ncbi:MAG: thioredoxin domain-containing protein, partial [Methylococcales bacterium]|nr:thioredoxin domain-containing protein [Methylococcales bacterium]
ARQDMHTPGVNAVLETDMQDVKAVGVRGTPTFFVNGRALSEFGPEPLRQIGEQRSGQGTRMTL